MAEPSTSSTPTHAQLGINVKIFDADSENVFPNDLIQTDKVEPTILVKPNSFDPTKPAVNTSDNANGIHDKASLTTLSNELIDTPYWSLTYNGIFTTKSTYTLIHADQTQVYGFDWIWKLNTLKWISSSVATSQVGLRRDYMEFIWPVKRQMTSHPINYYGRDNTNKKMKLKCYPNLLTYTNEKIGVIGGVIRNSSGDWILQNNHRP
ncbi:hypothetical protein RND71_038053 [Anisodus tanguticus]|uniref:Uncharacterized protein n=1 Tax=Anisodus tanguticus TaxID=243964 RepID=A0AAE1R1J0_9SOLA|nr:hypothetical protein RND71_038053 [Anisodus tanguticus]